MSGWRSRWPWLRDSTTPRTSPTRRTRRRWSSTPSNGDRHQAGRQQALSTSLSAMTRSPLLGRTRACWRSPRVVRGASLPGRWHADPRLAGLGRQAAEQVDVCSVSSPQEYRNLDFPRAVPRCWTIFLRDTRIRHSLVWFLCRPRSTGNLFQLGDGFRKISVFCMLGSTADTVHTYVMEAFEESHLFHVEMDSGSCVLARAVRIWKLDMYLRALFLAVAVHVSLDDYMKF